MYLSVITLTEVYAGQGTRQRDNLAQVEGLFAKFEITLVTPSIAKQAGILRRDFKGQFADMLIAATAIEYGFALATRNIKHFKGLPGLKLIKPY